MKDGSEGISPPGAMTVIRLLLVASWRRSRGRWRRQQQLFQQRSGRRARNWAGLGFIFVVLMMAMLHAATAYLVRDAVRDGERFDAERQGWVVAEPWFIARVAGVQTDADGHAGTMDRAYREEAARLFRAFGGDAGAIEARLRRTVAEDGPARLVDIRRAAPGFRRLPRQAALPALLGSLNLLVWFIMMACQGDGLELDIQRRRHPMWEFLFSHPVQPGAVFMAEMLAPLAANPIYLTAPVFVGFLYGLVYGQMLGWVAALAAGIPVLIAAACLGRALEVAVTLRFPPRSRGAMIGLMGWLGYATMIGLGACALTFGHVFTILAPALARFSVAPAPFLGLFLGLRPGAGFSFPFGLLCCWSFAAVTVSASVLFSIWGAQKGLVSNPGRDAPSASGSPVHFGRNALLRKEILWFARDRSALVQAFLVPLTLAGFQLFNMRGILAGAADSWNTLCGAAIVFGTYFLLVLGPKSLASEGAALWISLTWPQGLEALLRAKAWLWTMLACAIVMPVLIYAAFLFPASIWKIALAGMAWFLFARSMAAKTVTLATVTSESGEITKVPMGRRWAAQLGLLTFAVGILTAQWNLAVVGVTYSAMTAAAMWQNLRARLPYLYDPWSEVLPPPPTLMHAMIAISVLVELGAVLTGAGIVFLGAAQVAVARAIVYGVCAVVVSLVLMRFLFVRGVSMRQIWTWRIARPGTGGLKLSLLAGVAAGLALGAAGVGYIALVGLFPQGAAMLDQARAQAASLPHFRVSMFVMAVVFAPVAEEFLFRGLLYRALDREWGGWRAVLGNAAFFAIYHPALSWVPVALLGAANAVLFRRTGRLAPCVVAHMVYNAVVLM
jgi:membrane protease YdiL (CAAX protease family)